jgi:hypothetical protein
MLALDEFCPIAEGVAQALSASASAAAARRDDRLEGKDTIRILRERAEHQAILRHRACDIQSIYDHIAARGVTRS